MSKWFHLQLLILTLFLHFIVPYALANVWDPYKVINVDRGASVEEIKRSYRELARKLHPDKSDDDAGKKFIELNKAYDILKDPVKRSRYDQSGEIQDNRSHRNNRYARDNHYSQWTYSNGGKTFTFHFSSDSYFRKKSISSKQYFSDYIRESKTKPFFIFFYSDFCTSCQMIESTWNKIVDDLAKFDVGSFTINAQQEPKLAHDLGINSIPRIACLIDGQVKIYYQSELSLANIVKFTKTLLPTNLFKLLSSEEDQDRFIALGPKESNKLSAIIIHHENDIIKLRYLLLAYKLRSNYRFGHISTKLCNYKTISEKYGLAMNLSSKQSFLLVFDEDFKKPVIEINFKIDSVDINQLKKQLTRWPFLKLPRLSSQPKFDDLCLYTIPKDNLKTTSRLCVILFVKNQPTSQEAKNKLMEFIEVNNFYHDDRVAFAFIDTNKQQEFTNSLLIESKHTFPLKFNDYDETIESSIIVIERNQQNYRKALYKWLPYRWNPKNPDDMDKAKLELFKFITDYKINSMTIKDKIILNPLLDEDGPSLADRIFWRLVDQITRMIYYISSPESFSTIIILIGCALITSLFLYQSPMPNRMPFIPGEDYLSKPNDENFYQNTRRASTPSSTIINNTNDDQMKIIELKAETYNGMVRLLKPGFRSIVLLGDNESKDKLLTEFKKAVWPYRRNKCLLFGYLCLDKNLKWYKALLEEVLGVNELNVNKKNCIGTVLSLNGFKKYFRVYHAKHHEIDYYDDETDNDGSFLGFNDSNENLDEDEVTKSIEDGGRGETEKIYTVDNLLDRLPIWLDKMFDGLTKRYCLESWPDDIK